jgi:hypothetical protein
MKTSTQVLSSVKASSLCSCVEPFSAWKKLLEPRKLEIMITIKCDCEAEDGRETKKFQAGKIMERQREAKGCFHLY